MAQAGAAIPEQVLITGSLNSRYRGGRRAGDQSRYPGFHADRRHHHRRSLPHRAGGQCCPGPGAVNSGGHQERETRVNIRGLDQTGPAHAADGGWHALSAAGGRLCAIDPSIIPALALDRVDILADGASATYGSDAIAGVINVMLKRNFDGAVTLLHAQQPTDGGGLQLQASQLYGRTWDGGDVTLTYEWTNENEIKGTVHSNYTANFTPWGLDNRIPIDASIPGTVSDGKAEHRRTGRRQWVGTMCSNCFADPDRYGQQFQRCAQ